MAVALRVVVVVVRRSGARSEAVQVREPMMFVSQRERKRERSEEVKKKFCLFYGANG